MYNHLVSPQSKSETSAGGIWETETFLKSFCLIVVSPNLLVISLARAKTFLKQKIFTGMFFFP